MVKQAGDTVGQLDFASCAARQIGQKVEDARGQDVAADNGKVGRGFFRFGFFHDIGDALEVFQFFHFDDAVRAGLRRFDGFHTQNTVAAFIVNIDHLFQRALGGID